jgi:hypothetical protein
MSNELVPSKSAAMTVSMETAAVKEYFRSGNVAAMTDDERDYVRVKLCQKYDLDPILRPFDLISFNGGMKFYMTASATNQLANAKSLTREVLLLEVNAEQMLARCTVKVSDTNGRAETANAFIAVSKFLAPTKENPVPRKVLMDGEDLANALLKLETKAKRRATMSFFGVMDAGYDNEDRQQTAPLAAPDVSRPRVLSDAATAAHIVQQTEAIPPVTNDMVANPQPTPQPEKKRGRPAAAKAEVKTEPTEPAEKIEAQLTTLEAEVVPVEATVAAEAPQLVIYARSQHAPALVAAASELFGGDAWTKDAAKKEAVKTAIPILDKNVPVFAEGSQEILPEFKAALRTHLVACKVIAG